MIQPEERKRNRITSLIIAISIGLYLLSLTRECYCTGDDCADSLLVLLTGWLGVVFGGAGLSWLANPLILVAWISTKQQYKYAWLISVVAVLFCCSFLFFHQVMADEAGHFKTVTQIKSGYWIWLGSALTMMIGNLFLLLCFPDKKMPEHA